MTARARARMGLAAAEDPTAAVRAAISSNPTPNPDRMRALVDFLNPDNAPPGEGRYVASVALELLALAYRAETADRRNP
ncbi:hypothetical protein [Micromonospora carbonacea]|uniref:hypothetical protein n=1 Tax=Micromonospora carbonacea TaxID=47853 RepID=UPI0037CB3838